jgi:hypothetical protein
MLKLAPRLPFRNLVVRLLPRRWLEDKFLRAHLIRLTSHAVEIKESCSGNGKRNSTSLDIQPVEMAEPEFTCLHRNEPSLDPCTRPKQWRRLFVPPSSLEPRKKSSAERPRIQAAQSISLPSFETILNWSALAISATHLPRPYVRDGGREPGPVLISAFCSDCWQSWANARKHQRPGDSEDNYRNKPTSYFHDRRFAGKAL